MAGSLASINIKFFVDLKKLSTDLQNSTREFQKMGDKFQQIGKTMSLAVTAPLLAMGGASVKMASDFTESQNKVDVAFKESAGAVKAFAQTTLTSFGIAEGSALDMAALFGDMATSMGLPRAEAAKMSTALVGLAGDLASFKNIGIAQATTALNGVFTGETESLKMLGIVMTEANLAQFALSRGITKNIKDFTQAEKVQLRYAYVMAQTTNAQGDFARTGGGAANQTRVLQEGLKELGNQFGQVILPAFTKAVQGLNGFLGKLRDMEPATRNTVVVIAGIAAAIGPVLIGIGAMVKGFAAARVAVVAFNTTLAANPYTAAAIALGAIITTVVVATSRFSSLTDAQKEFGEVMKGASESIARETSELNKNLAIAKNDKLSKEQRLQAIKNLNALSPEYLGNLTLENINTKEATAATEKYTAALLQKAKVMAAQEKLVEVQKQLLDLQLGQLDAVKPSVWQTLGSALRSSGDAGAFAAFQTQSLVKNLGEENSELQKLQTMLTNFIAVNDTFTGAQNAAAGATDDLNIALGNITKSGTVDWYNEKIAALEKLKNSTAVTREQVELFEKSIKKLEASRDALLGKREEVKTLDLTPADLDLSPAKQRANAIQAEIDKLKQLQGAYVEGSQEFKNFQEQINGYEFALQVTVDPTSLIQAQEIIRTQFDATESRMAQFQARVGEFNAQVAGFMQSAAESFVAGFGEIIASVISGSGGLDSIFNLMLGTLAEVVIQIGKAAIGIGLAMESIKTAFANPATAIAAGIALVAVGSLMKNSISKMPKFADGGIVGGNSYYGDKILARLNSGELVLNRDQQQRLNSMITPAVSANDVAIQLMGGFEIEGSKLRLVLDRADRNQSRTR